MNYDRVPGKGRYAGYIAATLDQVCTCLICDPDFPWFIVGDFPDVKLRYKESGLLMQLREAHYVEMRRWFDRKGWEPVSAAKIQDAVTAVAHSNITGTAQRQGGR